MVLRDTYREIVVERIQKRVGFPLDDAPIPVSQLKRISDISEVLRQTILVEQMIKVEERSRRGIGGRISRKMGTSGAAELQQSMSVLEAVKKTIWEKCDDIASDILESQETSDTKSPSGIQHVEPSTMKCTSCGGNLTILAYNNYKCASCGLGYSAKDYLEIMRESAEKI